MLMFFVLQGLGMAMVSVSWLIAVYYNVIIAHVMLYLFASIKSIFTGIPWISCDNEWNTERCLEVVYGDSEDGSTEFASNMTSNMTTNMTTLPPTPSSTVGMF